MRTLLSSLTALLIVSCSPAAPSRDAGPNAGGGSAIGGGGGFIDAGGGGNEGVGGGGGGDGGEGFCFGGGSEGGGGNPGFDPNLGPVTRPARAPPPVSGGTMTVLASGRVAIADSDRDQVYFVNADDTVVTTAALQSGDEPGRVVEGPNGTVFVALRAGHQVAQVDSTSLQVTRFDVCSAPRGLAYRPERSQLLVACADGELATLDFTLSGKAALAVVPVADDLRDVVVMNGQVLVTTFRDAMVYAVAADGAVSPWSQPGALDAGSASFLPQVAWRAVATPWGLAVVHQYEQVDVVPDPTACSSSYGSAGSGPPTLFPAFSMLTGQLPQPAAAGSQLGARALPVDLAVSPNGTIAIAYAGAGIVELRQASSPGFPHTIFGAGQPVSVALMGSQALVFSREPATLTVYDDTLKVVATLTLSTVSADGSGHDLFHLQTENGIACASCHPEATDDGHVWKFVEGPRRTPTLRGGLKGTEPFHWSGDESNFTALMGDVYVRRMGGITPDDPHAQAAIDWLEAQPKRPAPSNLDADAVSRGEASFTSLGCVSCHSGALGTDNANVDVGTGAVLQVPRLAELAYSAPFFHDGSVSTLAQRFTAAGGAMHTATTGLTADQISDLVAYLKSR